jgi:hypothetical protein
MQNAGINIEIEVSQNNFAIKSISLYFESLFTKQLFFFCVRSGFKLYILRTTLNRCVHLQGRKRSILEQSNELAKSVKGRILIQESLLNEVLSLSLSLSKYAEGYSIKKKFKDDREYKLSLCMMF